jgi:hypothetical protein
MLAAMNAVATRKNFVRHFAEMVLVMFLGMGAVYGALALAGVSLTGEAIELRAGVMTLSMTVPMVMWMSYRGHAAQQSAEMAGAMVVPTVMALGLHWLGALAAGGVMLVEHVVMIPAMLGVMLLRYEHYSH